MTSRFLFSHRVKKWGWVAAALGAVLFTKLSLSGKGFDLFTVHINSSLGAFLSGGQMWVPDNLTLTISGTLLIIGMVLIAFSRLKIEDEFTSRIRLESLQWAVYLNYALLLGAFLFLYGTNFLSVMVFNMFTVLIVFILRFHWILYRQSCYARHEK